MRCISARYQRGLGGFPIHPELAKGQDNEQRLGLRMTAESESEATAYAKALNDCALGCSTASVDIPSELGATRIYSPIRRPHTSNTRLASTHGSALRSFSFSEANLTGEIPPSSFYTSASTSNFLGPPLPSVRVRTPPGSMWSIGIIQDSPIPMPQRPPDYIATAYPDPTDFSSTTGAVATLVAAAALDMEAFGLVDSMPLPEVVESPVLEKNSLEVLCEGALMQDYPNNYRFAAQNLDQRISPKLALKTEPGAEDPDETLSWSQSSLPTSPAQSRNLVERPLEAADISIKPECDSPGLHLHLTSVSQKKVKNPVRKPAVSRFDEDSRAQRYVKLAPQSPARYGKKRALASLESDESPAKGTVMETSCWTCKLRRKKCDSHYPVCMSCTRLGIECRGYDKVRPDFMTDPIKNRDLRAKIKLCARKPKRACV